MLRTSVEKWVYVGWSCLRVVVLGSGVFVYLRFEVFWERMVGRVPVRFMFGWRGGEIFHSL